MGDIVALCGMEDISIGDTVCDPAHVEGHALCKDLRADGDHDLLR